VVGMVGGWMVRRLLNRKRQLVRVLVIDQNRKHVCKKEDEQEQKKGVARLGRSTRACGCVALRSASPVFGLRRAGLAHFVFPSSFCCGYPSMHVFTLSLPIQP